MEALHSRLTTGEQSGGQETCQPESLPRGLPKSPSQPTRPQQTDSPKPHGILQQPKQSRRLYPERKRLRNQRQSIDSDTGLDNKRDASKPTTDSGLSPGAPSSSLEDPSQSKPEAQEGTPKQKRERKPQRPGKYVCTYCGRACAKPSVLQKHIRSHTGERPYPCAPCGFSFKTKSNLYKHRKSHTHKVKAGLALGEPRSLEEQVTESEDEARLLSSASCHTEGTAASVKSHETDPAKVGTVGKDDSYVKKRLALRLSRGKQGARDSSDEQTSSLILGSKGSTESGYFSRSESTEQSQDSPPNTSAKSYAEIILGKYGRLGHLQRMSRHNNQQATGQEDKSISFTVPKKQVIDHITKLITINEAVVDTSKIDSVKPRRFSLSRKNSSESQKSSSLKELFIHSPKAADLGYKSSGSITMGVPCEKFHNPAQNLEQLAAQTSSAPLVRSQSMPSAPSSFDFPSHDPFKFRQSQSFDERQPSEMQASRRYRMLRRQPAIEIPLGAELTEEEHENSRVFHPDNITSTAVSDHKQSQVQAYKCEPCCTGCKDCESYTRHKKNLCLLHHPSRNEVVINQADCSQLINHSARAGALTVRKRRKEESFEFDDPSSPPQPLTALLEGQCTDETRADYGGPRRSALQTCSVIQHTSSFEKQETLPSESQGTEATNKSPNPDEYPLAPKTQSQQGTKLATRKLVRQHSVLVPEILVTEDSNMRTDTLPEPASTAKPSEKPDEFQWPQRSPSLAQLPIEKLPPKKKRLRLTEAAQSSGESSFDSVSLPHSPSQDSLSTSFEESNRSDMESLATPLRRSRAPNMLTVPRVHQHREMRRSASEQAPHDPQPGVLMAETRSKSFDYSCLSPESSVVGWRERRKCLLMRHAAVRDPDEEEEEEKCTGRNRSAECATASASPPANPVLMCCSASPLSGDTVSRNPTFKGMNPQYELRENIHLTGGTEPSAAHGPPVHPVNKEHLYSHTGLSPSNAPQPVATHGLSGAARACYMPVSTGLKLEIPLKHNEYIDAKASRSQTQHSLPSITSSLDLLRPVTSPSVAVRLQTETLTPACAIYTTLSQSVSPRPQEAIDAVYHNTGIPTPEYRNQKGIITDLWSDDDDLRLSGSGGNKRMLSPSSSIELAPESQQQQKRVKEEEDEEAEREERVKRENPSCLQSVCSPVARVGPTFPSLLSSTCNSWCYLNYVKPNPSTLDEQKPSVYSSWSTSCYDPNPPGLSSKTALALLHCKQRLSPSIYTTSPMSAKTTGSVEPGDSNTPSSTEVNSSQSYCDRSRRGNDSSDDSSSGDGEKNKQERAQDAELLSCSGNKPISEVWHSEKGLNETHGVVRHRGAGERQCEECGTHLEECTVRSLNRIPCKPTCWAKGVCKEAEINPGQEKTRQDSENSGDESNSKDLDDRPKSKDAQRSSDQTAFHPGGNAKEPEPGTSLPLPPSDALQKGSASAKRAPFSQKPLGASASANRSPSTQGQPPLTEPPSPRSPSPSSYRSPGRPCSSPSSCHGSNSPTRPQSPVGGPSTAAVQSHGSDSSGLRGSLADTSARGLRFHSRDQPSTARLSTDEAGPTHIASHPARHRGAHNLLSHLPLHSQQLGRAPSQLIPIGGIHMIQPRSPLPLYKLVCGPAGPGTSWAVGGAPATSVSLPRRQDTLKEVTADSRAGPTRDPPSRGTPRRGRLDPPSCQNSQGRQPASGGGTKSRPPETSAHADATERSVYPETDQGQKRAPSSQTQL